MQEPVKRRYDNSRREAQTRATRATVVDVAGRLFVERGYPATTIEAIADESSTPLATLYRLFGSKRGILSAVLDVAFGGDDEPVEFKDRPQVKAALSERDPGAMLDAFAHIASELMERTAALQAVLASAATVDADVAEQVRETRRQRLAGQSRIASALAGLDALRDAMPESEAADIVYALMSPEVHRILTAERGWTAAHYEEWLASALRRQLLANPLHKDPTPERA